MKNEIKAKKHFGQHFLRNQEVCDKIIAETCSFENPNILEVGPGTGVLTKYFLSDKTLNFRCVEIDRESADFLQRTYPSISEKLIKADFLKLDFNEVFSSNFVLIGNFPYNISTQIVFKLLESKEKIDGMVGMFQKEVAQRIIAPHGSKVYGILSVLVAAYFHCSEVASLKPEDFSPPPKVDSAVIKLIRKRQDSEPDYDKLKIVVKAAFQLRRKTLRNSLKGLIDFDNPAFEKYAGLRPEQISWEDFVILAEA